MWTMQCACDHCGCFRIDINTSVQSSFESGAHQCTFVKDFTSGVSTVALLSRLGFCAFKLCKLSSSEFFFDLKDSMTIKIILIDRRSSTLTGMTRKILGDDFDQVNS